MNGVAGRESDGRTLRVSKPKPGLDPYAILLNQPARLPGLGSRPAGDIDCGVMAGSFRAGALAATPRVSLSRLLQGPSRVAATVQRRHTIYLVVVTVGHSHVNVDVS